MRSDLSFSLGAASQSDDLRNSSTEIRARTSSVWSSLASAARKFRSENTEVAFLTVVSLLSGRGSGSRASHVWMTERNESVSARIIPIRNPNGKDKLNSGARLLLMTPNSPEIKPFADEPRRQSVTADGQVMDRGAEGAAGGYDAV